MTRRRPEQPTAIPVNRELEGLREGLSVHEDEFREADRAREANAQAQKKTADEIAATDAEIAKLRSEGVKHPSENKPQDAAVKEEQRSEKARLKAYAQELYERHKNKLGKEFQAPGAHVNDLAQQGLLKSDAREAYRAYIERLASSVGEEVPVWVQESKIEVGPEKISQPEKTLRSVAEIDVEIKQIEVELQTLRETHEAIRRELSNIRAERARLKATLAIPEHERVLPPPSRRPLEKIVFESPVIEEPPPPGRRRGESPQPPARPPVIELGSGTPDEAPAIPTTEPVLDKEINQAELRLERAKNRARDFYTQYKNIIEGHKPEYHPPVKEAALALESSVLTEARATALDALIRAYDDYVSVKTLLVNEMKRSSEPAPPPDLPVTEEPIEREVRHETSQPPPPPGAEIGRAFDETVEKMEQGRPEDEEEPPEGNPHPQAGGEVEKETRPKNPKFVLIAAIKALKRTLAQIKEKVRAQEEIQKESSPTSDLGSRWTKLRQRAQDLLRETNPDRPARTTDRATWYRERTAEINDAYKRLEEFGRQL